MAILKWPDLYIVIWKRRDDTTDHYSSLLYVNANARYQQLERWMKSLGDQVMEWDNTPTHIEMWLVADSGRSAHRVKASWA